MASSSLWQRFQNYFLRYDDLGFSIDISRMKFPEDFFGKMRGKIGKAFAAMRELEAGAIANPDEKRMVGHYWLRNPALAPNAQLRADIEQTNQRIKQFAAGVHSGSITAANGKKCQHILLIGIGGSALGPQFVSDALGSSNDPMDIYFFDNTDPDGFDRVFHKIDKKLAQTLVVVVSKSGGTKETLIALYERAVGFYGSLVNVNAYHQPGVEAGKKAATKLLELQGRVRANLSASGGKTAEEIAHAIDADPEDVFHALRHLASNHAQVRFVKGEEPSEDKFSLKE